MKNWFIYYFAFSALVSLVIMYMGGASTLTYIKVGLEILMLLMYAINRSHDKEIAMKIIEMQSELLDDMRNTSEKILMMVEEANEEKDEEKGN